MDKLKKAIEARPDLKSDKSEYLKLATKEGNKVVGTGPQRVKVVDCKNAVNKDYQTQQEVKGVELIFEQDGQSKKYFVPLMGKNGKFHYLIERFADIPEGTDLIMEYKRREGSFQGYIDIQVLGDESKQEDADDIPVIEDSEMDWGKGSNDDYETN